MRKLGLVWVALLSGVAFSASAQQAPYPSKPVTVIIPFTPGSSQETEGRVHMNQLSQQLHQQFVIDFKPGGSTIIGLGYVAKQPADGYTLLLVSAEGHQLGGIVSG